MAVIALVGVPGAPGVTSTALGLLRMWPVEHGRMGAAGRVLP